jgi:hypothetical protein
MFLLKLNPIEPPWYGPVCPVVWEGRRREASPYPNLRREPAATSAGCEREGLPRLHLFDARYPPDIGCLAGKWQRSAKKNRAYRG